MRLFCDCKTDEEKSNFFLSGMAVETGVIAPAISNDVAMAYHRCSQFKKENDELRAKIERMEKQEPVKHEFQGRDGTWHPFIDRWHYENTVADGTWSIRSLYALPGAQGEEK